MRTKLLIVLIIVFCSCDRRGTNQTNDTNSIRVIDLLSEAESKISNLSEIASDVEYIPLETSENSMIKFISKVIFRGNNIYIKSYADNAEIMCFDRGGRFLYKLDKSGRGPEEYQFLIDYDITSDNDTLVVLSSNKILIYKNTGTQFVFLKSINLKRPSPAIMSFVPGSSQLMLSIGPSLGTEPTLSLLINLDGDTLNLKQNCYKYEKIDKINMVSTYETLQYVFDNKVYFKEEFSDTVFSVYKESNKFVPQLILDSRGTIVTPRSRGDREYAKKHSNEFSQIAYIYEFPRYIFYYFRYKNINHKIVYDKVTNTKFEIALEDAFVNNINGGPNLGLNIYGCTEDKFYSSIEALALKKYVKSVDFSKAKVQYPEKRENLKKIADSLKETDNPILIVGTSKN
jgi:hypothetical protein